MADQLDAQTALSNEQRRADLTKSRGRLAAKISDPEERKAYISRQGDEEASNRRQYGKPDLSQQDLESSTATDSAADEPNINAHLHPGAKALGSFKKGGKVKKTGLYKLHKKERVLNVAQAKKLAPLFGKSKG